MSARAFAALILVAAATCASAQRRDDDARHTADSAAALFHRSVFAHAYAHGYEAGFHAADQDIQMGRAAMDLNSRQAQKQMSPPSTPQNCDRKLYSSGYREGFRAGYIDSASGRSFRSVGELRALADGLQGNAAASNAPSFDRAFAEGYVAGRSFDHTKAAPVATFDYLATWCRSAPEMTRHGGNSPDYCEGYTRGYRLGYDDARQQPIEAAKNAKR